VIGRERTEKERSGNVPEFLTVPRGGVISLIK